MAVNEKRAAGAEPKAGSREAMLTEYRAARFGLTLVTLLNPDLQHREHVLRTLRAALAIAEASVEERTPCTSTST